MSARPQTTFAGTAANPFGMGNDGAKKPATIKQAAAPAIALEICNDPLPGREKKPGKYDELFAQMVPGQNLRCPPNQVGTISKALNTWLKEKEYEGTVRTQRVGKDGLGRVWWLAGSPLVIDGIELPISTTPRQP